MRLPLTTTFQRLATTLYRAYRYLKQHPLGVVVFLAFLFFAGYVAHTQIQDSHTVYDSTRVFKETHNTDYTIDAYSSKGQLLSRQYSAGVNVNVSPVGNLSAGKKDTVDTVTVNNGGDQMEVSGSTLVAYPTKYQNIFPEKIDNDKPIISSVIKNIPRDKRYGSKLLLIKTYSEEPIFATYGRTITPYYSNIDSSQVFTVDGKIIFVFRGEFSISDTTIFSE